MATALRPVAHEDRLSLVEHLTELRTRLIICIVAFAATTTVCFIWNQQVLDVLNRPLEQTVDAGNQDPLITGARYDQLWAEYARQSAVVQRRAAAVTEDAQLRRELLSLADSADKLADAAPEVTGR